VDDLMKRTGIGRGALESLAEAGALESLETDRRRALWKVSSPPPELALEDRAPVPTFDRLTDFETIAWDHLRTAHSVRGYPLEPLRAELRRRGLPTAAELARVRGGADVDFAGIVICRQRPSTAKGVVFMTLEDETGFVNVILWQSVLEQFALLAKTASFLGVSGKLQAEGRVIHVVASRLWTPEVSRKPVQTPTRDFH
jgi:error-prone DNA polymerase